MLLLEYIWLNKIDKQDIKKDIVLKVLKKPSLIMSESPKNKALINSKNVINIHAANKNNITLNVEFLFNKFVPILIIVGMSGNERIICWLLEKMLVLFSKSFFMDFMESFSEDMKIFDPCNVSFVIKFFNYLNYLLVLFKSSFKSLSFMFVKINK